MTFLEVNGVARATRECVHMCMCSIRPPKRLKANGEGKGEREGWCGGDSRHFEL